MYKPAWLSHLKRTEPYVALGSSCIDLVPGPSFISYVRSWASESIFPSLYFHICKTWKIVYLLTSLSWGFSKESCLTWNKYSGNVHCDCVIPCMKTLKGSITSQIYFNPFFWGIQDPCSGLSPPYLLYSSVTLDFLSHPKFVFLSYSFSSVPCLQVPGTVQELSMCVTLEEEEGGVGSWRSVILEEWTEAKWPLSREV